MNVIFRSIFTLSAVVLYLLCSPLHGQDADIVSFRSFSTEWVKTDRALSQNSVFCLHQDRDGFMWFGTWDGLNKFDGYKFTVFRPDADDSLSICSETVLCMHEDAEGYLWLGTYNGLSRLDRYTLTFKNYPKQSGNPFGLASDTIFCIEPGNGGLLYLGTNNGLTLFDTRTGVFQNSDIEPAKPQNSPVKVFAIEKAAKGFLWLATDAGLVWYDVITGNQRFHNFPPCAYGEPWGAVNCLLSDTGEVLWTGGPAGLSCMHTGTFKCMAGGTLCKGLNQPVHVSALFADKAGRLWIGTQGNGLIVYNRNTGRINRLTHMPGVPTSLCNDYVNAIGSDLNGNIWVGTSKGVSRVDAYANLFEHIIQEPGKINSLNNNTVWSLFQDSKGKIWIGTDGGVNIFDRESNAFSFLKKNADDRNSLSSNQIRCIIEDSEGDFWIGTFDAGINKYNPKTGKITIYKNNEGSETLPDNQVWSVTEDGNGNIWLGTMNGLGYYERENGKFSIFRNNPDDPMSLSSNIVYGLFTDSKGFVWVSTYNGLNRLNPLTKTFTVFRNMRGNMNSVSNNRIFSVFEDSSGILWICTMGGGLNRFEPSVGRFRIYTEDEGLANNIVYNILEDNAGNLWLSTNYGLSKFDRKTETFVNYDISDGIQSSEFNLGAACRLNDGELAFGGMNGFNILDPKRFQENKTEPLTAVTSFKVFNKPYQRQFQRNDTIELSYYDNFFSFEFAALDYTNPDKIRYAFILENLDRKWTYTYANRRFAEYTNVPPGFYIFKIKATNSQGLWGQDTFRLYIKINNVWWRTLWFRALIIVSILLTAGYFFYDRLQKIRKKHLWEKQKLKFEKQVFELKQKALTLQMNPHFIFNTLNSIQHFILRNNTDQAIQFMGKLSQLMRLILTGTREVYVPVINEIKVVTLYLDLEKIRFGDKFDYTIHVDKSIDTEFIAIPPMLIQPFVENAVLHGIMHKKEKGHITVSFVQKQNNILCIIEDDGVGRDEAMRIKKQSGMGHTSRGNAIIADRLSLFETNDLREKRIVIEDVLNEQGAVCGTKVSVMLPLSEL